MPSPSFIRVVETWVPSPDGSLLEFGQGLYHAAPGFGTISRSMCFGRGEGLPGHAWEEGRPILLPRFEGSYFLRSPAAQAAGLRCAVALPCFVEERIAAVVVLLCGDDEIGAGAIELWHHDPRIGSDMTLVDGWFGASGGAFEALSRDAYLPRGVGLPGLTWQRGEVVHLPDLYAEGSRFLRSPEAEQAGLQQGLAIPCETRGSETCVLTVLASHSTPIARSIGRWVRDADGTLRCVYRTGDDVVPAELLQPALQETFAGGVPRLISGTLPQGGAVALLPVTSAGRVAEVLQLLL